MSSVRAAVPVDTAHAGSVSGRILRDVRSDETVPWTIGLAHVDTVVAAGFSARTVRRRVVAGRWTVVLPRVIGRGTAQPTSAQWLIAATLYAGPDAVLSHATAAARYDLSSYQGCPHVTVPHGRRLPPTALVHVHQTIRVPEVVRHDHLPYTSCARAVIDTACGLPTLRGVRALVAASVQRGLVRVSDLVTELELAPSRGSRLLRIALEEVESGARSSGEAEFLALMRGSELPLPALNVVQVIGGRVIVVDAWWAHLRAAVEIDGRTFHLGPTEWAADLERQNILQIAGIVLLRFPASRLRTDPEGVLGDVRAFLTARAAELGVPLTGRLAS